MWRSWRPWQGRTKARSDGLGEDKISQDCPVRCLPQTPVRQKQTSSVKAAITVMVQSNCSLMTTAVVLLNTSYSSRDGLSQASLCEQKIKIQTSYKDQLKNCLQQTKGVCQNAAGSTSKRQAVILTDALHNIVKK